MCAVEGVFVAVAADFRAHNPNVDQKRPKALLRDLVVPFASIREACNAVVLEDLGKRQRFLNIFSLTANSGDF